MIIINNHLIVGLGMNFKYLGFLRGDVAEYLGISEHKYKPIIVFYDRVHHVVDRHLKEFGSKEKIEKIYNNLSILINNPDYIFYNKKTNGLEYYKKIDFDVCVAVRINASKVLKVKSWYPVNEAKINNRINKGIMFNKKVVRNKVC